MSKKTITGLFIAMTLAGAGFDASAGSYLQGEDGSVEIMAVETVVPETELETVNPAGFADVAEPEDTRFAAIDSPTQAEPESKIARRMTQAEKNNNAKENDGWGGAITIIAMCIVIAALAVLSILFYGFGKISTAIMTKKKRRAKAAAAHVEDEAHQELDSGEFIAAIALALSEHFNQGHDIEDTILTIHRMQKAYSPWNSKIYNLRVMPDHQRIPVKLTAFDKR